MEFSSYLNEKKTGQTVLAFCVYVLRLSQINADISICEAQCTFTKFTKLQIEQN